MSSHDRAFYWNRQRCSNVCNEWKGDIAATMLRNMRDLFRRFSSRREYRLASIVLLAGLIVVLNLLLMTEMAGGLAALAFVIGAALYVALVFLTYFRLQNALLSAGRLLPMIVVFHVGPRWTLGSWDWGSIGFHPSGLIALIPVMVGWFAAPKNPKDPNAREA